MICNNCKNRFDNINGLKFCPYCGDKIEENVEIDSKEIPNVFKNGVSDNLSEANANEKKRQFTQEMPVITKRDINKDKINRFFASLKKTFMHRKVIIPTITLIAIIALGAVAYTFFSVKTVDVVRINEDLLGQVVTLPKGTSIKINKNNMKDLSIKSRSTDESLDDIKVALTLNNGAVEAKTILSLVYVNEGKNEWKFNDKIVLDDLTSLKPVVGMNEKKFMAELKKLDITISDTPIALGKQEVKNIHIALRKPDLENGKEEILVETSIDSGLLATSGKIKCKLIFKDETWSINTTELNSDEDFKFVLSPAFSDEKVLEPIKEQGLGETVSYSNFFGGKGFAIKDSFTKNIKISSVKFDAQNGKLTVTAKRSNVSGQIESVLSTNYIFSISLSDISLLSQSKTIVDSATIYNISTKVIIPTITNAEIEESNLFFWWSNNHKVTTEEANTFKINEILSKKGFGNIKYVYGSITSVDGKNNEPKNISFVALYFLVYNETNGYNWNLDKLVGEDSPNYKEYTKIAQNQ